MTPVVVPAAILAFLLRLGCTPTMNVHEVDEIRTPSKREAVGLYCPFKDEWCPAANTVYLKKGIDDQSVLVHELWHSCQKPAQWGTREWHLNELQARSVQRYWRGEQ